MTREKSRKTNQKQDQTKQVSEKSRELERKIREFYILNNEYTEAGREYRILGQKKGALEGEIINLIKEGVKVRKNTKYGAIIISSETDPSYKTAMKIFMNEMISRYPEDANKILELYNKCIKDTQKPLEKVIVDEKRELELIIKKKKLPVKYKSY